MTQKKSDPSASSPFDLRRYLEQKRRAIDERLHALLTEHCVSSRLFEAMHYSLMGSGKRLRPVLCIAAADTVGSGETELVMRTACALEMIHTYSLIHDDLPAMDDDNMRRGSPTCHIRFDEATAILAGDALLSLAFEIISEPTESIHDPLWQLAIIAKIAHASGNRGMTGGQMLDVEAQGKETDLASLRQIHELKTGAMIEAAVVGGAIACGGTHAQVEALSIYARSIGLAFQVTDDILNVEGDPEVMGKSAGTDALRFKATYPALMGLDESKTYAAKQVTAALDALSVFGSKAAPLHAIARYILERKR